MNISKVAQDLIKAIEEYKKESMKKNYKFELDEQLRLQKEIDILNNHINILIDYETKKISKRVW